MPRLYIWLLLVSAVVQGSVQAAKPLDLDYLRCEYLVNPLGIDSTQPRFSWVLRSKENGQRQTAYQILVAETPGDSATNHGALWDSGKVSSAETMHVVYAGSVLRSGQRCWWKVRVWDKDGRGSAWSQPATWSMGLLTPEDWGAAKWIADPKDQVQNDSGAMPATMLRKSFRIDGEVRRATAYVTGLGVYELRLNGKKVGTQVLAPEFTSYDHRIQYQCYDVTDMLQAGANGVGALLATGWNGEYFFGMAIGIGKNPFQGRRGLLIRLEIELNNGQKKIVVSDRSWRSTREGPIRAASIYDGFEYDARLEWSGWDTGDFDDKLWRSVIIADYIDNPKNFKGEAVAKPKLVRQPNEPIRVTREIKPIGITEPKPGVYVVDMGQNMVGWCRLQVDGRVGTEVTMRYGEVLDDDGMLYTDNLRRAKQTDSYVRGTGTLEIFEPRFTYHGFRYVEISGRTNIPWRYEAERKRFKPELKDIVGCVLHSASPETGKFSCSSDYLNKLMELVQWTQRGNMHGIPTDCPQRCERAGWMGDIQAFSQTGMLNMDMAAFLNKWLADVRDAQAEDD